MTFESLLRQASGRERKPANTDPVRAFVSQLRGASSATIPRDPTYVLNERRVGYRMPRAGGGVRAVPAWQR